MFTFTRYLVCIVVGGWLGFASHGLAGTKKEIGRDRNAKKSPSANVVGAKAFDVEGNVISLGQDLRPVVLVFLDPVCPISRRYTPYLNKVYGKAKGAKVSFYGVLSDPTISRAAAKKFRKEYALKYPVLFDSTGDLASRVKPTHVPEAFVITKNNVVAYRGRIDNRFVALGKLRQKITSHDLLDAIEAVGSGRVPKVTSAPPVGCTFEAWNTPVEKAKVTYAREIAPVLFANCLECHRRGGIGPFALETYKQARRRAKMIARVCSKRVMPPWHADAGFSHFKDERVLSQREIHLLETWAKGGAPEGDRKDAPPLPPLAKAEWPLGKPDKVLKMPKPFPIPAEGKDIYRYFVIPSGLQKDHTLVALDFRAGDSSVVHHCIAYADYSGRAREIDRLDAQPGFDMFSKQNTLSQGGGLVRLAAWNPGMKSRRLPDGLGLRLKKGADIVIEVHYHLNGKATTDQSSVALYFAKKPVERFVQPLLVGTQRVDIRAGDSQYWRHVYMKIPADLSVIDISPHMHYLGKEVRAVATLPDGTKKKLLRISNWDVRWQSLYVYREPLFLPKGSRVDVLFRFDNSKDNPSNPNVPPKDVSWGWNSEDEMCDFFLTVVARSQKQNGLIARAASQSWRRFANPPVGWSPSQSILELPVKVNVEVALKALRTASMWDQQVQQLLWQASEEDKLGAVLEKFSKYIRANPKDAKALANYAMIHNPADRFGPRPPKQVPTKKVRELLERSLKLEPKYWDARFALAVLNMYGSESLDQQDKAVMHFRKLIEQQEKVKATQSRHAMVYLYLGELLEQRGETKQARQVWAQGLKRHPNDRRLKRALKK